MSDRADPIALTDTDGQAIRLLVDGIEYAIDTVHPLREDGQVTDIELLPYAGGDQVKSGQDYPVAEIQFVGADHTSAVVVADRDGEPDGGVAFQRDLALRQARLAEQSLKVIKMGLNDNRPLEALYTANNELDRLDEELDGLERLGVGGDS